MEMITLTHGDVEQMMTPRRGFTRKTVEALGLDFRNLPKGWVKALVGTTITEDVFRRAVAGAGQRAPKKRKVALSKTPVVHESTHFVSQKDRDELFGSFIWKGLRALLLREARGACQYCGRRAPNVILQVDHIIPITKDWSRRLDILNLQVLCIECNHGKSNIFS